MTLDVATKCVTLPCEEGVVTGPTNPPIVQSAGFSYADPSELERVFNGRSFGHIYSRISNPTITQLERHVAYLDDGLGAVALSSGLSAIFSLALVLGKRGHNMVVSNALFGGTRDLFQETISTLGCDVRFCDISSLSDVERAIDQQTVFVFAEIISNPTLVVPDISALARLTNTHRIPLIIDATLTGSVGFHAKSHGVDIVVYSSTKLLSANGGAIGGMIVDTGQFDWGAYDHDEIQQAHKKVGAFAFIERLRRHAIINAGFNTSPMNAYFTMMGLQTVSVRYDRICENAQAIAQWFHSKGVSVMYPGLSHHPCHGMAQQLLKGYGPLMTIDLTTKKAAFSFIRSLQIVKNMANLGDNCTMVIHPKSTIYARYESDDCDTLGITDGMIRISVGIESVTDIISEFEEALNESK